MEAGYLLHPVVFKGDWLSSHVNTLDFSVKGGDRCSSSLVGVRAGASIALD